MKNNVKPLYALIVLLFALLCASCNTSTMPYNENFKYGNLFNLDSYSDLFNGENYKNGRNAEETVEESKEIVRKYNKRDKTACFSCNGSGKCAACSGTGRRGGEQVVKKKGKQTNVDPCPFCRGTGVCPVCGGVGR